MITKDRKKIYDGTFFGQGLMAPAQMEMAFGYWDKAAIQLERIVDKDTVFSLKYEFRDGMLTFVRGMAAVSKGKMDDAIKYSNGLDALLGAMEAGRQGQYFK